MIANIGGVADLVGERRGTGLRYFLDNRCRAIGGERMGVESRVVNRDFHLI